MLTLHFPFRANSSSSVRVGGSEGGAGGGGGEGEDGMQGPGLPQWRHLHLGESHLHSQHDTGKYNVSSVSSFASPVSLWKVKWCSSVV